MSTPHEPPRYVFIAGCPRSGTTALAGLLNDHPGVVMGMERYKFRSAQLDPSLFEPARFLAVESGDTDVGHDLAPAAAKFASGRAAVVGDKIPGLTAHLGNLRGRFAAAKVLFLLRDPLMVAESFERRARNPKDRWPEKNDAHRAPYYWNRALADVHRHLQEDDPVEVFAVEYELLFGGDASSFTALTRFLELPTAEELVQSYERSVELSRTLTQTRSTQLAAETSTALLEQFDLGLADQVRSLHLERNAAHYEAAETAGGGTAN